MEKKWFVYLVECGDGSFYCGVTNDLERRMKMHAEGKGSKYVYRKGFRRLLKAKECLDRSDACKAECFVKSLPKWEKVGWFNHAPQELEG